MQDPRMMNQANQRKQKSQRPMISQVPEDFMRGLKEGSPMPFPVRSAQKTTRKGMKNDPSLLYQPQERSKPSAHLESSTVGKEYIDLQRKFFSLGKESSKLGNELSEAEDEIKSLEDEKLELLDQLVVLEGLVDPSEVQHQ